MKDTTSISFSWFENQKLSSPRVLRGVCVREREPQRQRKSIITVHLLAQALQDEGTTHACSHALEAAIYLHLAFSFFFPIVTPREKRLFRSSQGLVVLSIPQRYPCYCTAPHCVSVRVPTNTCTIVKQVYSHKVDNQQTPQPTPTRPPSVSHQ